MIITNVHKMASESLLFPTTVFCIFTSYNMNWLILIIAGFFEMAFAACLGMAKGAVGRAQVGWYVGFLVALTVSMVLLVRATQAIPIGTAYAVWTGIGAVGTVLMGIFFFKEPVSFWRLFFLMTLIASVVGLKVVSGEAH